MRVGDEVVDRFSTYKSGLLLAYLVLNPGKECSRRELTELLWPDVDASSGLTSLRQALTGLRRILQPEDASIAVLEANRTHVRLNPETITTDVWDFESALLDAGRTREQEISVPRGPSTDSLSKEADSLQAAVATYSGELLRGYQEYWIEPRRTELAARAVVAAGRLSYLAERSGDLKKAVELAVQCSKAEPFNESYCLRVMRLYDALGDSDAALTTFREFRKRLEADLGELPSVEAEALAREIRSESGRRRRLRKDFRGNGHHSGSRSPGLRVGSSPEDARVEVLYPRVRNRRTAPIWRAALALLVTGSAAIAMYEFSGRRRNITNMIPRPLAASTPGLPTPPAEVKSRIVYSLDRGGTRELWSINDDGSNPRQLTHAGGNNFFPVGSPDGKRIAYINRSDKGDCVCIMNSDGSGLRRLSPDGALDTHPVWSPDGARIAFERRLSGVKHIFTMNADGKDARQVTTGEGDELEPAWSPDGSKIAYCTSGSDRPDIFTISLSTGAILRLTSSGSNMHPSWSPDGRRIGLVRLEGGRTWQIFCMDATDGSDLVRVSQDKDYADEAWWSPDGSRFVFMSNRTPTMQAYTVRSDGTHLIQITTGPGNHDFPNWLRVPPGTASR